MTRTTSIFSNLVFGSSGRLVMLFRRSEKWCQEWITTNQLAMSHFALQRTAHSTLYIYKKTFWTVDSLATFVALKVLRYGIPNERVPKSPLKQWVFVKGGGMCGEGVVCNQINIKVISELDWHWRDQQTAVQLHPTQCSKNKMVKRKSIMGLDWHWRDQQTAVQLHPTQCSKNKMVKRKSIMGLGWHWRDQQTAVQLHPTQCSKNKMIKRKSIMGLGWHWSNQQTVMQPHPTQFSKLKKNKNQN